MTAAEVQQTFHGQCGNALGCPRENTTDRVPEAVVGVKLMTTGGIFSTMFSDPVQINGLAVIPAGATAQGIVTKKGDYSPEMTLTSVTVKKKSHLVTTVSISFKEKISYPAASEVSFDLVSPLELTQ